MEPHTELPARYEIKINYDSPSFDSKTIDKIQILLGESKGYVQIFDRMNDSKFLEGSVNKVRRDLDKLVRELNHEGYIMDGVE